MGWTREKESYEIERRERERERGWVDGLCDVWMCNLEKGRGGLGYK